ncbi:MAG: EutN/CcmL family microcompartment protein [Bdellovibrionia bacterium]
MILARVVGEVVSSQKEPNLQGLKLLLVQSVDLKGETKGSVLVAVDAVGAGVGEVVLYASGSSARQTATTKEKPVDAVIMAIVDSVDVKGERTYSKETDAH